MPEALGTAFLLATDGEPIFRLDGEWYGCLVVEAAGDDVDSPRDPDCCVAYGQFPDIVAAGRWAEENQPAW